MEKKNNEQEQVALQEAIKGFEQAQKDWYQLSHLIADPRLGKLVSFGKGALPDLFEKLRENCTYCLPIERIVEDLDVDMNKKIKPDSKFGPPPFGSLEAYKGPYLQWWEKNRDRLFD